MSLRLTATAAAGLAALVALGSCSTANSDAQAPREVVQPIAEAPKPVPAATQAPVRTTFSYRGELEQGGWIRGTVPNGTRSARLGNQDVRFDEDGTFFAAFDRDQGSQIELVATLEDGRTISSPLTVKPRDWELEYINAPYRAGRSSAEFERLRGKEVAQIVAAREKQTGADGRTSSGLSPGASPADSARSASIRASPAPITRGSISRRARAFPTSRLQMEW